MDPVSVAGLAGSVVGIVDVAAKTIGHLNEVRKRLKSASLTVMVLISHLSTVKAALNQIQETISSELGQGLHHQLVIDLEASIQSCGTLVSVLDVNVSSLEWRDQDTLNYEGRVRVVLEGRSMKEYLGYLSHHINALNLLLTALNCRTAMQQRNLLEKKSSQQILNRVRDDSSSLIVLCEANSMLTGKSRLSDTMSNLSRRFTFDPVLVGSTIYQKVLRSAFRRREPAVTVEQRFDGEATTIEEPLPRVHTGNKELFRQIEVSEVDKVFGTIILVTDEGGRFSPGLFALLNSTNAVNATWMREHHIKPLLRLVTDIFEMLWNRDSLVDMRDRLYPIFAKLRGALEFIETPENSAFNLKLGQPTIQHIDLDFCRMMNDIAREWRNPQVASFCESLTGDEHNFQYYRIADLIDRACVFGYHSTLKDVMDMPAHRYSADGKLYWKPETQRIVISERHRDTMLLLEHSDGITKFAENSTLPRTDLLVLVTAELADSDWVTPHMRLYRILGDILKVAVTDKILVLRICEWPTDSYPVRRLPFPSAITKVETWEAGLTISPTKVCVLQIGKIIGSFLGNSPSISMK